MLNPETIQINRYKGIDNSKVSIVHSEIATLKTLVLLNKEKERITAYNKLNHVAIKGFSANFHNYKRSENNFSIAENLFREQLELNGITNWLHEHKVQIKDALNQTHTYHLDFFIPEIKLAIEISPLFHFTYETVAIRDKLRESLLKRKLGINTIVVKVHFRTRKGILETYINPVDSKKAIAQIRKLSRKPNKETLTYYVKGGD
jgi:hypothetical protein